MTTVKRVLYVFFFYFYFVIFVYQRALVNRSCVWVLCIGASYRLMHSLRCPQVITFHIVVQTTVATFIPNPASCRRHAPPKIGLLQHSDRTSKSGLTLRA